MDSMLENSTGTGSDTGAAALRKLGRFSGAPVEFWTAYIDAVAAACHARRALLVGRRDGVWRTFVQWPLRGTGMASDGAQAQRLADRAARVGFAAEEGSETDSCGAARAMRIDTGGAQAETGVEVTVLVLLFEQHADPGETIGSSILLTEFLLLGADIPAQYEQVRGQRRAHAHAEKLLDLLTASIRLGEETQFMKAALFICNDFAARFQCDRVTLGWREGEYIRLQAMSHIEKFDRHMSLSRQLESAMEEAFDQDEDLSFPAPAGGNGVTRAHEQYARAQGTGNLLSIPLRARGDSYGVITAERRAGGFTDNEGWEMRLLCDAIAARLHDLHEKERWIAAGVAACRARLRRLWGPDHALVKTGIAALLLSTVVLAVLPWPYRIEAAVALRSEDVAFISAPFDGYLRAVHHRIGDTVQKDTLLADLDTRELQLDESSVAADVARYAREAEKALVAESLADMQIAAARREQAAAKLQLIRHNLAHAQIRAPMDGIVVEGDLKANLGASVRKGDLLFKVARIDRTYAELEIPEADVHEIHAGSHGEIAFVGRPDMRFPIHVNGVDPAASQKSGKNEFLARATIDSPAEPWWRPGMEGSAKIDAGKRSALWILTHRTVRFLQKVFWL